ncbi:MAG TPA: adenylosuccinate synthase [Gaiellales bacterium]|jgi:adenylosuccinate synthase|nr:adenylosuccinate synthase [Gaiellales bacterium]
MPCSVVVGAQWGDEGKGKIVDTLAERADVVARYQGGNNAGHTLVLGDDTYKLRLVPSGILWPGTLCVIGNGCVIDPEVLMEELDGLEQRGIDLAGFRISGNAHLIMPWHRIIDADSELMLGRLQIGTTRRGIGPAYADKASRVGIRVQDLLDEKILRQKIQTALSVKNVLLRKIYHQRPIDKDVMTEATLRYAERIRPFIADTSLIVNRSLDEGKVVLCEGAQATLLDLDHGTYPFVTSSNPIAAGACVGLGFGPTRIDAVLGVAKAYVTRVGAGGFPSEADPERGERIRDQGAEYGTVTGRERRCGWLDLVALRYATRLNGFTQLAVTKLDVLSIFESIPVCTHYTLPDGTVTKDFPGHQSDFHHAQPVYADLQGWNTDISDVRDAGQLPAAARDYLDFIEQQVGVPVAIAGIGQRRDQIITLRDVLAAA